MTRRLMAGSLPRRNRRIGPAQLSNPGTALRQLPFAALRGADQQRLLNLLRLELHLQRLHPHLELGLLGLEPDTLELSGDFADLFGDTLGAFLFPAQRAHQHLAACSVGVSHSHTRIARSEEHTSEL